MLTKDNELKTLITEMIDGKFQIDLVEVKLDLEGTAYEGKGYLFQDPEGQFNLRFFSNRVFTQNEALRAMMGRANRNSEGDVINEYYSFWARDKDGFVYTARRLTAYFGVDNVSTFILYSTLYSTKEEQVSRVVFVGDYDLPKNGLLSSTTKLDNNFGYSDHSQIWEIKLDQGPRLLLSAEVGYLDMVILHSDSVGVDFEMVDAIADSLDFVLGIETQQLFVNVRGKGQKFFNRRHFLQAKSTFSAPLVANHRYGDEFTANHNKLFRCYLKFLLENPGNKLSNIQKTVVSGSRNYIYAAGLTLSVQIENLCREYFLAYYKLDEAFLKTLEQSIALIGSSDIVGKDDFVKRLEFMRPAKGKSGANVTNILNNMAAAGLIDKNLVGYWKKMRNSAAHGDTNDNDWEEFLANYFCCTNLFYQIVFALVGYSGKYSYKDLRENNSLRDYPAKAV